MPARNGVTAVSFVLHGFTATEDMFSGPRNFFQAYTHPGRKAHPEELTRGLGEAYEIMNTNIKRWSVGSPIQAPLDSILELMREHQLRAEDVESLVVRVSHTGATTTDNRTMPDICMQQMCAVMLMDGIVTFESAHDTSRMDDPRTLEVRRRIELRGDDDLQARLPAREGIVELRLTDGRELSHHTFAVKGTPESPMNRDEVEEKCDHLMAPRLGARRSRELCQAVWNLERFSDIREIRPLLSRGR
jgi:2-methylcitrate dehydratase PrpD